ncbi:MAG: DUF4012 domain-containing protein [Actinomycetota bacterium]
MNPSWSVGGPGRPRRLIAPLAVGIALVFVAGFAATAFVAARDLFSGRDALEAARAHAAAADIDAARTDLARAAASLRSARRAIDSAQLRAVGLIPYLGRSVRATSALAEAAERVAVGARDALESARAFSDSKGDVSRTLAGIDWDGLGRSAKRALDAFDAARTVVRRAPSSGVLPPIADARARLLAELDDAEPTARKMAAGIPLARAMLGFDGARKHLFVIQNGAEPRATGGAVNALVLMTANRGDLELVSSEDDAQLPRGLGQVAFVVNESPDFPEAAAGMRGLYREAHGVAVDSVTVLDANALAKLLAAGGPTTVRGETMTEAGLPMYMARDIYARHPDLLDRQDFNRRLVDSLFSRLTDGKVPLLRLARALGDAAHDKHVLIWSPYEQDQRTLVGLGVSGSFGDPSGLLAVVGNSSYGQKLGSVTKRTIGYGVVIGADGRAQTSLALSIRNDADPAELPARVLGYPADGVFHTDLRVWGTGRQEALHLDVEPGRTVKRSFTGTLQTSPGVFRLRVFRQPSLVPDDLDLVIELPAGARVTEATDLLRQNGRILRFSGPLLRDLDLVVRY